MVHWTPAMKALLWDGKTNQEIQAEYPELGDRAIASMRYIEKRKATAERPFGVSNDSERPLDDSDNDDIQVDWEARWSHLEAADEIAGELSTTKDVAHWTSTESSLPIGIVFVGDIHAGASGVRYDLLRRDMELLRDTEGLYGICLGDILENTKPQSKAGNALYDVLFSKPGEQLRYAQDRMKIAAGKWLALCQGNHDAWDGRWAGIDRLPDLAKNLGATYFTEGGGTVFVTLGGERYAIVVRHNVSGNSRINTSNPQRRTYDEFNQWTRADCICIAHFHYNDLHHPVRNGKPVVWFRSGTYKVRDAYSQAGGFHPEYGNPLLIIYPDERKMIPFRGDLWLDGLRFLQAERERYAQAAMAA